MNISYKKKVNLSYEEALEKTIVGLKQEGFGIITKINVTSTLKEKLGVEFTDYTILGACNPDYAHRALLSEIEIGLRLPCNVLIYTLNGETFVSAVLPTVTMGMIDNDKLDEIAEVIEIKLKKVVDSIAK
jgi:uncharacterized protein (DUF302 family)